MEYIKGFVALFILLTLFLYLVPDAGMKKYIRFFAEIVLAVGFLSPVLDMLGDSDTFFERIAYTEFTEQLSEISRDMERMEYVQGDYFLEEYEDAIEIDVVQIAGDYGFGVREVEAELAEDYTLEHIYLEVCEGEAGEIVIGEIHLNNGEESGVTTGLSQELADYYQMEADQIEVLYCKTE